MPESLTTWKIKVWTMGTARASARAKPKSSRKKNLIVRLQAPRFFTQKDEVVLSANVHNYLKDQEEGDRSRSNWTATRWTPIDGRRWTMSTQTSKLPPTAKSASIGACKVIAPGEADDPREGADERRIRRDGDEVPRLHPRHAEDGIVLRRHPPGQGQRRSIAFTVPAERRAADSRLEVRYSPTLAGAMVDALPYLVDYPYGCTEQTLNRFLPTVITQKVLLRMNLDLKDDRDRNAPTSTPRRSATTSSARSSGSASNSQSCFRRRRSHEAWSRTASSA